MNEDDLRQMIELETNRLRRKESELGAARARHEALGQEKRRLARRQEHTRGEKEQLLFRIRDPGTPGVLETGLALLDQHRSHLAKLEAQLNANEQQLEESASYLSSLRQDITTRHEQLEILSGELRRFEREADDLEEARMEELYLEAVKPHQRGPSS